MSLKDSSKKEPLYGKDERKAVEAKEEAQRIAWAPFVFQAAKSMRDLGILSFLQERGRKGATSKEIADQLGLSLYGVRVLLEAGLGIGLVQYWENECFTLTKTGHFIQNDRMTNVNMDFVEDVCFQGIQHLKDSVRTERPEGLKVFGDWPNIYEGLSELPEKARESWFAFDNFYSAQAFDDILPYVLQFEPSEVYDVGGNIGKFTLFLAASLPTVRITLFDLPGQLKVAEKNVKEAGYDDIVSFHSIDFLKKEESFPKGADVIWMSQFLDCFSEAWIRSILERAKEALNEDGAILILETLWDRQRFEAGSFSLQQISLYFTAMANGSSQMYHSRTLIEQINEAGLYVEQDVDGLGIGHTLLVCRKKA